MTGRSDGRSRRQFGGAMLSLAAAGLVGWRAKAEPGVGAASFPLYDEAVAAVFPEAGIQSRIALGDAVLRLVAHGVIDPGKFLAVYGKQGGLPAELAQALGEPLPAPIRLTRTNAGAYVNLLWPVGLANSLRANVKSPMNGDGLDGFASTGGWWLGREDNGGAYFNQFPIVSLTPAQEAMAVRVAQQTYRPCCNNSTFFQDCNHGSALYAVLQLGAAQGLAEDALYREALAFNAFWFPDVYIHTALYFRLFRDTEWRQVDPREVMGFHYSAVGPWRDNVQALLAPIPDLIPQTQGGARCAA